MCTSFKTWIDLGAFFFLSIPVTILFLAIGSKKYLLQSTRRCLVNSSYCLLPFFAAAIISFTTTDVISTPVANTLGFHLRKDPCHIAQADSLAV